MTTRTPIVAGNWKMNTSLEEARSLASALVQRLGDAGAVECVLIPPFPWVVPVADVVGGSGMMVGAQNCAIEDAGAFTGEVSAAMLAPLCRYIIVGHSERRHLLGENDETVAAKLRAVLRNGARPILCVGELLEQREAGQAKVIVEQQLVSAFQGVSSEQVLQTVVAYEPVWAIGTGRAATPDDADDMARWIREVLARVYDETTAAQVRIQYGGSVNAANAAGFLRLDGIDGALVGGASLKADDFARIVASAVGADL